MRIFVLTILFLLPAAAQTGDLPNPCQNFYQYACGTWMARNPIPPDQARWGRGDELAERNREILRDILEKAAAGGAARTPDEQKIGDYYAACLDVAAIQSKGIAALQPELDRIAALADKTAITAEVARLHRIGVGALFNFGSGPDFKNSDEVIAHADQGGLGMPDRDYYLKDDARSVELRRAYSAHVEKMFALLGAAPERSKENARTVMEIERVLAKGSLDRTARRDPARIYHRITVAELISLDPGIGWTNYFAAVAAPKFDSLNVTVPNFFRRVEELIVMMTLDQWKVYLTWQLVHARAAQLPEPFGEENFNFFSKTLRGVNEQRPRWKRCVSEVDSELGDALGKAYVERTFGAEGKARTLKMVEAIEKAMEKDIGMITWMSPETRKQALVKLHAVTNKIGYPDKWRDYSSLNITRDDALGNAARSEEFELKREMDKIGKPVDRGEWNMTPPTVNAFYQPTLNSINFLAGILQPPFFDKGVDEAVNFGAIGSVIGHELTHGFDDRGRRFDEKGNLRNWWTEKDGKEFESRAQCFADEYSAFTVSGDVHLNGKLTLGENTADNGGLRLAFMALHDVLGRQAQPKKGEFTIEQRFFLGFAQIYCSNQKEEDARLRATTDPHSPFQYRVNGVLQNMPEFQKAFACSAGQPMVSPRACRVW